MKKIVIKIGSSSLVDKKGLLDLNKIDLLMQEIVFFKAKKIQCLIVTSGAIALGANKISIKPNTIEQKQACAAIGQAILMHAYDESALKYGIKTAQILVNHDDFENRKRLKNLEATINALIEYSVVPIINENDALAVEEIRLGDNDTLSALITKTVKAEYLILISDIDGLYDKNPKIDINANLIKIVTEITTDIENMAGGSLSDIGTGGMITKIKAAKIVTTSGANMLIINNDIKNLKKIFSSEYDGTLFLANKKIMSSKKHWVLYNTKAKGSILIDEGAKNAILNKKSLLPKGIIDVIGDFAKGNVLYIKYNNEIIAKGVSNYNSEDIIKVKGLPSNKIEEVLGYKGKNVIIHVDNIVIGG